MKKRTFNVEVTDTFGGEANYCWVRRMQVKASSLRGAISIVSRESGYSFRKDYDCGDMARYSARGACVCAFIAEVTL
jgi:hypothetical protein